MARQVLREFLSTHAEIEVIAECANGFEAVKVVTERKPDLVFLDIQMPKLDGFEVLELMGAGPAVIFVTAHDTYAIRAFEAHAVDYLLKPFNVTRFEAALERASRIGENLPPLRSSRLPHVLQHIISSASLSRTARAFIIPIAKLDYAEAQDDYVELNAEGKKYLKQQTISSLESGLDPARFIRIHRSYIANLERITKVEPYAKDSHVAVMTNGKHLPVSRAGYSRLRALLDR